MTDAARVLRALRREDWVSGRELADSLSVSRTRVWHLIGELRTLGYRIASIPGCGYRWRDQFDPLDADLLARWLPDAWTLGVDWYTDSTSDRVVSARVDCHIRFAEHQSAGRGRVGREWLSPPGGLYLSAGRWFPQLAGGPQSLSPWIACFIVDALRTAGFTRVCAKWPNDLIIDAHKFGGILVEIAGDPFGDCYVCVGVGVNWYAPGIDEQLVTGLAPQLPTDVQRNDIGALLAGAVANSLDAYPPTTNSVIVELWRQVDGFNGTEVTCCHGDRVVSGTADGIEPDGSLRLCTEEGLRHFAAGELRLRAI
jgi:BirA family biotin operon repressor/biotin-[acetyl-CoA-carboxylase] ligase